MANLSGRVAIVTGGASGIGRATALLMASRGAKVVISDVSDDAGRQAVSEIKQTGGEATYVRADVSSDAECAALVATAQQLYGGLHIAFNNAGITENPAALTADTDVAMWDKVLRINLSGVFYCMRHELNAMRQGGGSIVNTSSVMGLKGKVGGAAYCASKHGVIGLTRAAALEYGRYSIRVNAICPGYVATALTVGADSVFTPKQIEAGVRSAAIRRLADPVEVASMVVWLSSDEASFVTGADLAVDGGVGAG